MNVTAKLLQVFLVDKQLRGLQARLRAAERFLGEQERQLGSLGSKKTSIEGQVRQLKASTGERESEIARLDARIDELREQMNTAKTNKEYKAFLGEVNNLKEEKGKIEEEALELISKTEELQGELGRLDGEHGEREKVRSVATGDRDKRAEEVKGKVEELQAKRDELAADVPGDAMRTYEALRVQFGEDEDAMAPIEEQDRRRHEYTCGNCMMNIPIESVSALMSHGSLTRCVSCSVILYLDEDLKASLEPKKAKASK